MIMVTGRNGRVEFDGVWVTIRRKGVAARVVFGRGDKRMLVRTISAIQWKPAGVFTNGFIQFTVPGGNEVRSRLFHQTSSARTDENSVTFGLFNQRSFLRLREAVERAISMPPQQVQGWQGAGPMFGPPQQVQGWQGAGPMYGPPQQVQGWQGAGPMYGPPQQVQGWQGAGPMYGAPSSDYREQQ